MENTENKSKRGGARAGAGRKREEHRRRNINLIVSDLALERLKAYSVARGISQSEAASQLFESLSS